MSHSSTTALSTTLSRNTPLPTCLDKQTCPCSMLYFFSPPSISFFPGHPSKTNENKSLCCRCQVHGRTHFFSFLASLFAVVCLHLVFSLCSSRPQQHKHLGFHGSSLFLLDPKLFLVAMHDNEFLTSYQQKTKNILVCPTGSRVSFDIVLPFPHQHHYAHTRKKQKR